MVIDDPFDGLLPFVEVAERRSFRAAAEALGVTPASVSRSIKRLEVELGVTLLHRTTRQVRLSQEGTIYLAACREALAQVRAGREQIGMSRREARGQVRISASFVFGAFMVRALPRFFARYPGLEVDLRLTDRRVRLVREDVDIALRIGRLTDSELVGRKLRDASWRLVASPTYLAARGTPRERSDLAKHDAVLFRTPRGKVKPIALADGVAPTRNRLCLDQGPLVLDAAVAGLGIAQVFDFMCESAISRGELLSLLPDHMPAAEPIFALTTKARRRHPRVRVALDFLSEILSTVHGPLTQHG